MNMDYYQISAEELGQNAKVPLLKLGDSGEVFYELALEMIGYPQCSVEPLYLTDRSRWAEIYIDVPVSHDINYDAILTETLKVKTARTLPHLRFAYTIRADEKVIAVGGIGGELKVKAYICKSLSASATDSILAAGSMHTVLHAKVQGGT